MTSSLLAFLPVAALLTITPGVATALVVRSAARGGQRDALLTTAGNSLGVLAWGCFAALGIAAVVATSAEAFTAVKLAGAIVLVAMGVQSLRGGRRTPRETAESTRASGRPLRGGHRTPRDAAESARASGRPLRDGLVTSLANPKLAVFFVALFGQFVPPGAEVLPAALLMAGTIVALDLVWYSALALAVARARRAFVAGPWQRRVQRLTGGVLVGLGVRLAFERR